MKKTIAVVSFLFVWTLTTHGKYSASGDEPHYLMIAQSLVADGDLDLANNYANNDGRLFGHDHLATGPHARADRAGRLESVHDIGLAVLLAVPYAVARAIAVRVSPATLARFRMDPGLFTYSLVSLTLIALTAFGMGLVAEAAATVGPTPRAAWLVLLAAISPPVSSFGFLIFPEAVALFVTAAVVWYSTRLDSDDRRTGLAIVAALGALPWMHRKYSFYVLGLLFVLVWCRRDVLAKLTPAGRAIAAALFVLPQAALHAWTLYRWGNLGGPQMLAGAPFSAVTWGRGLLGLWLDRQSGLLAYAPLYWLVPFCWISTWRRTWPYVVPALLLYLPMASFVEWWGGFSPAGRYLAPIVPLCLIPIAVSLRNPASRATVVAAAVPQLAIDAVVWQHPRALWPTGDGANAALAYFGAVGRVYSRVLLGWRGADM